MPRVATTSKSEIAGAVAAIAEAAASAGAKNKPLSGEELAKACPRVKILRCALRAVASYARAQAGYPSKTDAVAAAPAGQGDDGMKEVKKSQSTSVLGSLAGAVVSTSCAALVVSASILDPREWAVLRALGAGAAMERLESLGDALLTAADEELTRRLLAALVTALSLCPGAASQVAAVLLDSAGESRRSAAVNGIGIGGAGGNVGSAESGMTPRTRQRKVANALKQEQVRLFLPSFRRCSLSLPLSLSLCVCVCVCVFLPV